MSPCCGPSFLCTLKSWRKTDFTSTESILDILFRRCVGGDLNGSWLALFCRFLNQLVRGCSADLFDVHFNGSRSSQRGSRCLGTVTVELSAYQVVPKWSGWFQRIQLGFASFGFGSIGDFDIYSRTIRFEPLSLRRNDRFQQMYDYNVCRSFVVEASLFRYIRSAFRVLFGYESDTMCLSVSAMRAKVEFDKERRLRYRLCCSKGRRGGRNIASGEVALNSRLGDTVVELEIQGTCHCDVRETTYKYVRVRGFDTVDFVLETVKFVQQDIREGGGLLEWLTYVLDNASVLCHMCGRECFYAETEIIEAPRLLPFYLSVYSFFSPIIPYSLSVPIRTDFRSKLAYSLKAIIFRNGVFFPSIFFCSNGNCYYHDGDDRGSGYRLIGIFFSLSVVDIVKKCERFVCRPLGDPVVLLYYRLS